MLLYLAILCTVKLISLVAQKNRANFANLLVQKRKEPNSVICKTLNDSVKKQISVIAKVFYFIISIKI